MQRWVGVRKASWKRMTLGWPLSVRWFFSSRATFLSTYVGWHAGGFAGRAAHAGSGAGAGRGARSGYAAGEEPLAGRRGCRWWQRWQPAQRAGAPWEGARLAAALYQLDRHFLTSNLVNSTVDYAKLTLANFALLPQGG